MTYSMMMKLMVLSLLVITIGADEYLMKKECSKTEYQVVCLKCLESDPSSYQSDLAGFARINAYCLESELARLALNVTLAAIREVEPIKKVLDDCYKSLSITSLQVREVQHCLVTSNYDKALESLKTALGYPLTCRDNLQKLKYKTSPHVYDQIGIYAQHSIVVRNLIEHLKIFI